MARRVALLGCGLGLLLAASTAFAHNERAVTSPIRPGSVPALDRPCGKRLVVCKADSKPTYAELLELETMQELRVWRRNRKLFAECRYEHIQDAVDAAPDGACIQVLPGVYLEEPSRAEPTSTQGDNPDGTYSFAWHLANPNDANLIGIIGKKNLTLEGMGADPRDVVIDAGFAKDVVIRGDRSDGIIVRNFWARDANEHAIYLVEVDGYVFDRTVGSYAKDYQLFSTGSDNGLFTDCEAFGGSDSGLYIGQSPDTRSVGRWSAEVRRCKMHHNALGFSGTQGNSVWMHDNEFTDNAVGISYDTENSHVNPPQRASLIENNWIHHNNFDVYAEDTDVPVGGPGRSFFHYPVGTGAWLIGGEDNLYTGNRIHDNGRFGVLVAANPIEEPVPAAVHGNAFVDNLLGAAAGDGAGPNATNFPPGGDYAPGGSDFYWDETGNDNCWGPNEGASRTDPLELPGPCPFPNEGIPGTFPDTPKFALLVSCLMRPILSQPGHFRTTNNPYVCPFGGRTPLETRNAAERECGDGALQLGEVCDPALTLAESCSSLGQGAGALACGEFCAPDTSLCEAPSCGRVGKAELDAEKLRRDGELELEIDALETEGRSFDPRVEGVEIVLRGDEGVVWSGEIPAGARGWRERSDGELVWKAPHGKHHSDIRRFEIGGDRRTEAELELSGADLRGLRGTEVATAVLRIADDCWRGELSCDARHGGREAHCSRTIPIPKPWTPPPPPEDDEGPTGPCAYCGPAY
jgi:hypothetical protein